MNHTPIDIEQQEFSSAWRGINAREVRDFLHSVARQMAEITHRHSDLRAQLAAQKQVNDQMQAREDQVKDALVLAQRTVEGLRAQTEREGKVVLEQAALQAQRIVSEAEARHGHLTQQVGELARQRVRLMEELRGLLATHSRLLDVHAAEVSRQAPQAVNETRGVLDLVEAPLPPGGGRDRARRSGRERPQTARDG